MNQAGPNALHLIEASSAKIQIYTLGTLQVVRDSTAVTESDWHTRQARQLLKILLTERPRPVSTDVLIEILWPHSTLSAAATTLRSAINALRNVLEPDRPNRAPSKYIVTQAPGYAFHLTQDIWLDVEEFERRLTQAHSVGDAALRLYFLEGAIALYQDDYLISDPYADWLQTERERLRERFFNALLQAADLYADAGHYADAIANCRRLLASDEVRENAYQALMRYQAESGDSAGALLTYERCRTLLSDELGADPSPMTQQLHQRILNGEVEPRPVHAAGAGFAAGTAVESALADGGHQPIILPQRTLLPVLDSDYTRIFVGREAEVDLVEDRLQQTLEGRGALLLLEGEAGVGKTRLAFQVLGHAAQLGATVISATCQILERDLPFAPLADSLGRYLYGLPDVVVRSLPAASLAQLMQIIPSLQDRLSGINIPTPELAGSAEENRLRLIDAVVAFFVALANQRPLALFLDDLHWADPDTLSVLSRLAQRLADVPLFLLISYRSEDLPDNGALAALLHGLKRSHPHAELHLERLNRNQVEEFVKLHLGPKLEAGGRLGSILFETTNGNPLFVTETLRDMEERWQASAATMRPLAELDSMELEALRQSILLRRNQRVQEIILERIERLPADAHTILNLCAVIGRDFSLDLLERAAAHDPLDALEVLLDRKFLIERPDERLDFSHQVVRQAVYDSLNILQRRRLHLAVAGALVDLHQDNHSPSEVAMHYSQSGASYRLLAAEYNVRAGERLLRTYGFRQAIEAFDRALKAFEEMAESPPTEVRRALEGMGLAYESLFDAEGVTNTYRQLQMWARKQGDRPLMIASYSRLTTMLGLFGQQSESNVQLRELLRYLASGDAPVAPSRVLVDLLDRRELIYSRDENGAAGHLTKPGSEPGRRWQPYLAAPRPVADPVEDLLKILEPVHAVPPLFDYAWTLLVQGELGEATRILESVVDLATLTNQPSIASAAYHQLAVTARILGESEQSQALNDQSIAINRARPGTAAELGSMWPRIASGFLSLQAGRLEEAERRLRRVADFLSNRRSFRNYYNSTNIGLGLVALEQGKVDEANSLLTAALADPVHLYPYTHVHALLGLARIAQLDCDIGERDSLLCQALRFAGRRSLLEEYIATVLEVARFRPAGAPVVELIASVLTYVESIGLEAAVRVLRAAAVRLDEETVLQAIAGKSTAQDATRSDAINAHASGKETVTDQVVTGQTPI
jgi:DNA-binding SARP family transcriptional activator